MDSVDPVLSPAASRGGDTVINAGRILGAPRPAPGRRYITGRADSINMLGGAGLAATAAMAGWSGHGHAAAQDHTKHKFTLAGREARCWNKWTVA